MPNKKDTELMNLFWTTAGVYPGEGEISRYNLKERIGSASKAGFKGIGIWHTDLLHNLKKWSLKEISMMCDDHGIKHIELEFLTDWFLDGPRKEASDKLKRTLFEASQALHAKHIKVGDFNNTPCTMPRIIDAFVRLCEEAQDYDAIIGFEFMPSAMIDNLPDALTMVETAGARNGGLIIDIAHLLNKGNTLDEFRHIPLRYLINLELNDGTFPGSPMHDPSRERRFCGEGEFDIKGFIQCAIEMGYTGSWAVEVFSRDLLDRPLDELNQRAFETTIALFEKNVTPL